MSFPDAGTALHVATLFFVANVVLGISVRLGIVSTKGFGWVHHALFFVVVVTAVATVALGLHDHSALAWGLFPVLAVFAVLPRLAGGTRSHTVAALAAAVFYAAAYALT